MITVWLRSTQSKRSSGHFANGLRFEHFDTPTSRTAHFANKHFANAHFANAHFANAHFANRPLRERTHYDEIEFHFFYFFKKVSKNFLHPNFPIPIAKCSSSHQDSKTFFSRFLDGSIPSKTGHVNREYGGHSKVTSLQALLRKAFRSPGVLVIDDFGFSAYFYRSRSDR